MYEFFAQYGPTILAVISAVTACAASITGLVKVLNTSKEIKQENAKTKEDIKITREGVIEAFKTAKIPSEWKVSVSNQVTTILTDFRDEMITMYKENEKARDLIMIAILKILNFTAASNKLTEAEKQEINDLIKQITPEDNTIDITE